MGNVGILVFGITEMTHPNNASLVGPLFSFAGKRAGKNCHCEEERRSNREQRMFSL